MQYLKLHDFADRLSHLKFTVYLTHFKLEEGSAEDVQLLKNYFANLAVEGVLCARRHPPDVAQALKGLNPDEAMALEVKLVRSPGILKAFSMACSELEHRAGPALNGHAPTVFAASRIAQISGNPMSTILSRGGLNTLQITDILSKENERGGELDDPPSQNEARYIMDAKRAGASGAPKKSLREALSEAEMVVFEAELAALDADVARGAVEKMSVNEALKLLEQMPR